METDEIQNQTSQYISRKTRVRYHQLGKQIANFSSKYLWQIMTALVLLFNLFALSSFFNTHQQMNELIHNNQRNYALLNLLIDNYNHPEIHSMTALSDLSELQISYKGFQIQFDISQLPAYSERLTGSFNENKIYRSMTQQYGQYKLSYQLADGKWLNYSETPINNVYRFASSILFIDFLFFALLFFHLWSINRLKAPLQNLKQSAERLGIDLNTKLKPYKGSALVSETSTVLGKLQERVQELIRNRTQLLAAISHDLRTPITRMKLRAQFIEDSQIADKITADLDEMLTMINGTLNFSSNDMLHEPKTKLDLISLIVTLVDDYQDQGEAISIANNPPPQFIMLGRMVALRRCFSNIINNGLRYGQQVEIFIEAKPHEITLRFNDHGPGIPLQEMPYVFKAFYRSEATSGKKYSGTGLGLTVAKECIEEHGGSIELANLSAGGLSVVVKLPSMP